MGKTFALSTIPPEYKVRILFTENGLDTLGRAFADKGQKIPPNFAWRYVKMARSDFTDILSMTQKLMSFDYETITKLAPNQTGKDKQTDFYSMLAALHNFTDERTGEVFGDASTWDNQTVLVIDSLTGMADAMMRMIVGLRPTRSQPDWQIVQNHLERLYNIISQLDCHVIVNGHWEREQNEVTGSTEITLSLPGKKLSAKLPRFWSDTIISRRLVNQYFWSTVQMGAEVKTRHLRLAEDIPQNYGEMLKTWRKYAEASL